MHKVGHSLSSGAEVKNKWDYTSIPLYIFIACTLITLPFKEDILFASICLSTRYEGKKTAKFHVFAVFSLVSLLDHSLS